MKGLVGNDLINNYYMADFKYGDITEKIIVACFKVHGTLGSEFQEVIYQRALELELKLILSIMHVNLKCRFIISISILEQEE